MLNGAAVHAHPARLEQGLLWAHEMGTLLTKVTTYAMYVVNLLAFM